jgi:thioredoxin reductase
MKPYGAMARKRRLNFLTSKCALLTLSFLERLFLFSFFLPSKKATHSTHAHIFVFRIVRIMLYQQKSTYQDHYGVDTKLPSYLSRAEMLKIMLQRVTRHNPHFFDIVQFNTTVEQVFYNDTLKKFSVVVTNKKQKTTTGEEITETRRYDNVFDKFIWAAGSYSRPRIPKQLAAIFAPFAARHGRVIHSSNASRLQTDAGKDKHVLLIGGSYSAEDLTLMAIKLGAKHVTICTRSVDANVAVLWQEEWPGGKVTILKGQVPVRVSHVSSTTTTDCSNGTTSTSNTQCTVEFVKHKPDEDDDESESESSDSEKEDEEDEKVQQDIATVLTNVDTVIFCTGYESNWDMMDRSAYNIADDDEYEVYYNNAERLQLPPGWTMPHNVMTDELKKHGIGDDKQGNVTPSNDIGPGYYAHPYSYNEVVSIYNHNLFYFNGGDYDAPLMALDAQAFVMLAIITGAHEMPPGGASEMKRINHQEALYEMTLPAVRFNMDKNYRRAIRQLPKYPWPKHWAKCGKDLGQWQFCRLGQLMRIGRYPMQVVNSGGTLHDGTMVLNDKGRALLEMDYNCRKYSTKASVNNTFRDIEAYHCRHLASIHTGAVPVPFGKLWMDIDDLEQAPNMV